MVNIHTTQRFMAFSDLHAPYQDEQKIAVALAHKKAFKPHITLALGDWVDGYHVSSYGADITDHDQLDEYDITNDLLDRFEPDYFLEGNHEQRFFRSTIPQGYRRLLDPKRWLHIKERGIKWIPYTNDGSKLLRIGKLGFHHGFGFSKYVACKNASLFGSVVFGHTHRQQVIQHPHILEQYIGYNIGCLCDKHHGYAGVRDPHGWVHGYIYGYIYKSGNFVCNLVRLEGEEVHIDGKHYRI